MQVTIERKSGKRKTTAAPSAAPDYAGLAAAIAEHLMQKGKQDEASTNRD